MTSPNGALDDRLVELPAWAVEKATGQTLKSWMSTDQLRLEVTDDPRRPSLGDRAVGESETTGGWQMCTWVRTCVLSCNSKMEVEDQQQLRDTT
eukprot:g10692.t1